MQKVNFAYVLRYIYLYPIQEFMLKNDTLKNGAHRIGLYEVPPPPPSLGPVHMGNNHYDAQGYSAKDKQLWNLSGYQMVNIFHQRPMFPEQQIGSSSWVSDKSLVQ